MIHYTLQGPKHKLEIHDDKLHLKKRIWWKVLSGFKKDQTWALSGLSQFDIVTPKYVLWGKLEWQTFDGIKGEFEFTTNSEMMKKIEKYMHKLILKNHEKIKRLTTPVTTTASVEMKRISKKKAKKRKAEIQAA